MKPPRFSWKRNISLTIDEEVLSLFDDKIGLVPRSKAVEYLMRRETETDLESQ